MPKQNNTFILLIAIVIVILVIIGVYLINKSTNNRRNTINELPIINVQTSNIGSGSRSSGSGSRSSGSGSRSSGSGSSGSGSSGSGSSGSGSSDSGSLSEIISISSNFRIINLLEDIVKSYSSNFGENGEKIFLLYLDKINDVAEVIASNINRLTNYYEVERALVNAGLNDILTWLTTINTMWPQGYDTVVTDVLKTIITTCASRLNIRKCNFIIKNLFIISEKYDIDLLRSPNNLRGRLFGAEGERPWERSSKVSSRVFLRKFINNRFKDLNNRERMEIILNVLIMIPDIAISSN